MLTVSAADLCLFSNLYVVSYESALDNSTFRNLRARHEHAVDDLRACAHSCPVNRTEFLTEPSMTQPCVMKALSISASGPMYCGSATASSVYIFQVESSGPAHCSCPAGPCLLPQGVDGPHILPVALELVGHQLFAVVQHGGYDVLAEVMAGVRIFHVGRQHLAEQLPVEDVDAHGSQIALGLGRLLLEFHDAALLVVFMMPKRLASLMGTSMTAMVASASCSLW